MTGALEVLHLDNEVFKSYLFWASVLAIKMLAMSILTGSKRFSKKAFANPEDLSDKKYKVKFDDPDVERIRRAHRNDLENIPIFLVVAFVYLFTNPSVFFGCNLIRAFAIGRIVHTVVYAVLPVPQQPLRGLAFGVGVLSTIVMSIKSLVFFF